MGELCDHVTDNSNEEDDGDNIPNNDIDDNISLRIQKINRRKSNLLKNQNINSLQIEMKQPKKDKIKKKKMKKKKESFVDKVWLGWNTNTDELGIIFKIYLFVDKFTPKWMRQM